ncbi:hypothetical protein FA95DRAFT_1560141 [Auriscalpium vulgare]|uniref:Uncharacterized protein n=1 Tax=Auriscalpium vulgare TaxID=40419 RepID=A0ACB8RQB2_9AGAM|nr:hypothetical protein FA95DRAFT_1560141 [Auriscalpium vulgare]
MSLSTSTTIPRPQLASPPFANDPLADVAFRSRDGTVFLLSKHILSIASPVFADMFSLAHPIDPGAHDETLDNGIAVVPMADDSVTLDLLLRWCYPIRRPKLKTLEDVRRLAAVSQKYAVDTAIDGIEDALQAHLWRDPWGVFAVAASYHLTEMTATAARSALALPLAKVVSSVPASRAGDSLNVLIQYHIDCGAAAAAVTADRGFFFLLPKLVHDHAGTGCDRCLSLDPAYIRPPKLYAPRCLWEFLHAAGQALLLHPHADAIPSYNVKDCDQYDCSVIRSNDLTAAFAIRAQSTKQFVRILKQEVNCAIAKVPIPTFT